MSPVRKLSDPAPDLDPPVFDSIRGPLVWVEGCNAASSRRENGCQRIGDAFTGDIGRTAVEGRNMPLLLASSAGRRKSIPIERSASTPDRKDIAEQVIVTITSNCLARVEPVASLRYRIHLRTAQPSGYNPCRPLPPLPRIYLLGCQLHLALSYRAKLLAATPRRSSRLGMRLKLPTRLMAGYRSETLAALKHLRSQRLAK